MNSEKKTIIGVIGPIGSGKDTVTDYISKKLGIESTQISQGLKNIAKERGLEPTRENLVQLTQIVSRENESGFLSKVALRKITGKMGIIGGARQPELIEYLRNNSKFMLLAIIADPEVRFQRSVDRNKLGEANTLEEFIDREQKENSAPNVQRLFECMKLADYSIENNGDLETLHKNVDKFLERFNLK